MIANVDQIFFLFLNNHHW